MHMDPEMPMLVGVIFAILIVGMVLRLLRQPSVVAYIIVGVLLGPFALQVITDTDLASRLGAMGVVMLLFFVGMETDPSTLKGNWRIAVGGTLFQIALSMVAVWLVSLFFSWPINRVILLGFVISLSSTAVIIKLLQDGEILDSKVGQGVLSILLAQDLAIVPMLLSLNFMGGGVEFTQIIKQIIGGVVLVSLLIWLFSTKTVQLPFSNSIKSDREIQVFAALSLCFGFALLTAWLELSAAFGAFMAGLLVGVARETEWVSHALEPLQVIFLAIFFVSVGLMLDLHFLYDNAWQVSLLVLAALISNTLINAVVLKLSDFSISDSIYAGFMLAQIGEFSFVLAAVGLQAELVNYSGYQMILSVITVTLFVSPAWIAIGQRIIRYHAN